MKLNVKRIFWLTLLIVLAISFRFLFEKAFLFYFNKYSLTQFLNIFLHFLFTGLAVLIFLGILIRSDSSPTKLPWLLLLSFEPFLGLALFLTFGRNFKKSFRYLAHPLIKDGLYLTHEPITNFNEPGYKEIDSEVTDIYKTAYNMAHHHAYLDDSSAMVLRNGENYYPKLIEKLESADKFIFMQFYIIRTDKIGKKILEILEKKAKQGVEVKLLYDAIGSVFLNKRFMRRLKKNGVKVVANDKVYFGFFNTRINYRNHRKVTIVDGKYGFIGGMNLGDEYNNESKKYAMFRDTQLMLEGKAVNSLTALFLRDLYYAKHKFVDDDKYYISEKIEAKGLVQIIPSGPDFEYPPIRNTYVKMINNAKISIKIMSPYLALDQEVLTSLIIASKGGVEVSLILPGKPDKKSIYIVTKSFFEQLLAAGVKIYLYKKTFTHAKILIVDDFIASCGTYNLDNRSARINFEATVLLYNDTVNALTEDFELDLTKSKEVLLAKWKNRGLINRLVEGLFNLFSPLV